MNSREYLEILYVAERLKDTTRHMLLMLWYFHHGLQN